MLLQGWNTEPLTAVVAQGDEVIRRQVWGLLAGMYPNRSFERRADQRFPYPHLLYLTPATPDGLAPLGEPVVVVGKHLSERGLGFFHQHALPHRRMIASLGTSDGHWIGFLIDLMWCRFTQHGWYDSGGRFLTAVPSPLEKRRG